MGGRDRAEAEYPAVILYVPSHEGTKTSLVIEQM